MPWNLRNLLWDISPVKNNPSGVLEYVWAAAASLTATFDPASLGSDGGALSNGNKTMSGGSAAGDLAVYGSTGFIRPGGDSNIGFAAEFTIDVFSSSQKIVIFGDPGSPVVNHFSSVVASYAGTLIQPGFVSAPAFVQGDVIGMIVWGEGFSVSHTFPKMGIFRNGTFLGAVIVNTYAPPPFRFGVQMTSGQITVETDITAMAWAAAYEAYTSATIFGAPPVPVSTWPAP